MPSLLSHAYLPRPLSWTRVGLTAWYNNYLRSGAKLCTNVLRLAGGIGGIRVVVQLGCAARSGRLIGAARVASGLAKSLDNADGALQHLASLGRCA